MEPAARDSYFNVVSGSEKGYQGSAIQVEDMLRLLLSETTRVVVAAAAGRTPERLVDRFSPQVDFPEPAKIREVPGLAAPGFGSRFSPSVDVYHRS